MATITEDYVSFEVAKLLKEKGFNGSCNRVYQGPALKYTTLSVSPLMSLGELGGFHPKQLYVTNDELGDIVYAAPTQQMAMVWLMVMYNIFIEISRIIEHNCKYQFIYTILDKECKCVKRGFGWNYEEVIDEALIYVLENLI